LAFFLSNRDGLLSMTSGVIEEDNFDFGATRLNLRTASDADRVRYVLVSTGALKSGTMPNRQDDIVTACS
jgi:hypothetical protein